MPIECFADEVAEEYDANEEAFGEMLRNLVQRDKKLEASHYAFGLSRLGLEERKVNERWREVVQAMNLVAIMGTPEQRLAALDEAATAAAVYEKETPKLAEQIAKLVAKRDGLERDARLSSKRVEQQAEAVLKSREFVPRYISKRVGAAETLLNTEGVGADLRAATSRLQELKCILNLNQVYESQNKHLEYGLRRQLPDAVRTIIEGPKDGNRSLRYAYSDQWPSLKAECQKEYDELSERLPEIQREYDEALAIVQAPLGYWTDPKNWEND